MARHVRSVSRGRGDHAGAGAATDQVASDQQGLVTERFHTRARNWNDLYERDDLFSVIHQDRQARALGWVDLVGLPMGARALEVGPGAGLMTVALAQRGLRVAAVETAPEMIQFARRRAAAAGVAHQVSLMRADGCRLPFADGEFSLVVALGVVPWLRRPEAGIAEMVRVLRPDGYLIVNADNRHRLNVLLDPRHHPALDPARVAAKSALRALRIWPAGEPVASVTAHRLRTFNRMLTVAGLDLVERSTFGFGPFTMLGLRAVPERLDVPLNARLQHLADRGTRGLRSRGNQYLVLARRPDGRQAAGPRG